MSNVILDFPVFVCKAMGDVVELRFENKNAIEKKTITIDDEHIYLDHYCDASIGKSTKYEKSTGVKIEYSEFYHLEDHIAFFKEHLDYASYAPDSTLYMGGYKLYVELANHKIYDFGGAWTIRQIVKLLLDEYDVVMRQEDGDFD